MLRLQSIRNAGMWLAILASGGCGGCVRHVSSTMSFALAVDVNASAEVVGVHVKQLAEKVDGAAVQVDGQGRLPETRLTIDGHPVVVRLSAKEDGWFKVEASSRELRSPVFFIRDLIQVLEAAVIPHSNVGLPAWARTE